MKILMSCYLFLKKIFSRKNLVSKYAITVYSLIIILNIYYFFTLFILNFKIKKIAENYKINLSTEGISLSGYPLFPKVKIKKINLNNQADMQVLSLNSVDIRVALNKVSFVVKSLKFQTHNIEINPEEPYYGEYNFGLKESSFVLKQNKSFLNVIHNIVVLKNLEVYNNDIVLHSISNSSYDKLSFKGLINTKSLSTVGNNEFIFDIDKISKHNDVKFKITDIYQFNKCSIKSFANLDIKGALFFQKNAKFPIINLNIFTSNYMQIFEFLEKKLSNNPNKETNFVNEIIKFYKLDLLPHLKKNEISPTDSNSVNIKVETKNNTLVINNIPGQELGSLFTKKFFKNKLIQEQMMKYHR